MKTLGIVTAAIFLGLSGAAMANGQDSQQGDTNATGPNPYMPEFSTPYTQGDADTAYAQYPLHHHVAHRHVER